MNINQWGYRVLRNLFNKTFSLWLAKENTWQSLRFYPITTPDPTCFNEWNIAEHNWQEYQTWIENNSLATLDNWNSLKEQAYHWKSPPKISIVTPVYNTSAQVLYECIFSVLAQAYPYWQLILVDDASSLIETRRVLQSDICKDPRIEVYYCKESQGISKASNVAIEKSQADYVLFLDHDDRLSLDALFWVADEIRQHPDVDIIYSDRDMISPAGKRYMHLFKPDWSPETLLSGNYIFHLMCYRQSLLNQLGGYRSQLDGSQDYDLILRAIETNPKVRHIQKVLYHWRQYQGSVALDSNAKDYAFKAGVEALNQALQRRGISGNALEIESLWRGNYQLNLHAPDPQDITVIKINSNLTADTYTKTINQSVQKTDKDTPYIALISQNYTPATESTLCQLAAWLQLNNVGLASGSIISNDGLIDYIGASYKKNGELLCPYQGSPLDETGYMAITKLARNISAPHPYCVVIRQEIWHQLNGLETAFSGYYGLLDFALRAQDKAWRCVSVPQAQFINQQPDLLVNPINHDKQLFFNKWQSWLEYGDPFYNKNLNRENQNKAYYLATDAQQQL